MAKNIGLAPYAGNPEAYLENLIFWFRNLYGLHNARDLEACLDDLRARRRLIEHELSAAEAALEDAHVGNNHN